jgi:hypothetical protein
MNHSPISRQATTSFRLSSSVYPRFQLVIAHNGNGAPDFQVKRLDRANTPTQKIVLT